MNQKCKIEFIVDESNEWQVLKVNSKVFCERHRIMNSDWINLLDSLGYEVEIKEISDKDMDDEKY